MKKPKVFANEFDKNINNNQKVFDINSDNATHSDRQMKTNDTYNNLTVMEKISKLLNRNGYIFNVDVIIITKDKDYHTKIAGKVDNRLITLDNDIIKIDDIIDLKIDE